MMDLAMQSTEHDLREMLGCWLRSKTDSAKDLADRVDIDPRTAEGYRAGRYLPPLPVFFRMLGVLGEEIYEAAVHPAAYRARLQKEYADHAAAAAAAKIALDALGSDPGGVQPLLPSPAGVRAR